MKVARCGWDREAKVLFLEIPGAGSREPKAGFDAGAGTCLRVTVILATLGYTAEKVTGSIRTEPDVERVVAFVGSRENRATRAALEKLSRACASLDITLDECEIGSAYDFVASVIAYRAGLREHTGKQVLFNVSGGTGVMQSAAAFVCFTARIPMVYFNVEEQKYVRLPIIPLVPADALSPQQMRVLRALVEQPGGLRPGDLAKKLRLSTSNVDYHLAKLVRLRMVEYRTPAGTRRSTVAATELARIHALTRD